MENLIVIEGEQSYQYKDLKGLVETFVSKNYYTLSPEEKMLELEKKTIANTMQSKIEIFRLENSEEFKKNAFILYDEKFFILSMLKFNKFILLERKDANIFGKYIKKDNITNNYIIINKFVDEIMIEYLKTI